MYLCEYSFNREDPNIPGYSMDEVDYYAWIPAKFHSQIPNHRLTLMKNLMTGEYEFHRVYMKTAVGSLSGLGIVVTHTKSGLTEVAYKTKSLQEAVDWGNREWDRFHHILGEEHHNDKICKHVYPERGSFCSAPAELQKQLLDEKLQRTVNASVETEEWNGTSIRREDKGHVSNIRCQHPTCKTHPFLRVIYWVEGNIPIGRCCIKKGTWGILDRFL